MADTFVTLAEPFRYEPDKIKGSRFVASLAPAANEIEAQAYLERIRDEYRGASHTCWAWRLDPAGQQTRSSDDGEPAGSAGRPILAQLEGHEVTQAIVCVTRWFGGTKLGVGGLVRAYGGAAGMALDRASLVTREITARVTLRFPYDCTSAVQAALHALGREPVESEYGAEVCLALDVPRGAVAALLNELGEGTQGRLRSTVEPPLS